MMWWSYLLAAVGITGIWLAGRNNKAGWAIGLGAQVLWLAYAINTRQWGFIITAVAYGFVYGRNWWKWNKADPRLCQYILPLSAALVRETGLLLDVQRLRLPDEHGHLTLTPTRQTVT